ncbi:MAG: hypothetical protein P1V36_06840, partial [Planctomycetota bacterium]|nr:hypothetical protein [Planctomycetota bacterium]
MLRVGAMASLLFLVLLAPRPLGAEEAAEEAADRDARLTRAVASPAAVARIRAVDEALDLGPAARDLARRWTALPGPHARASGWHVLGRVGSHEDLQAAIRAAGDHQPTVALEAARAVLGLAARLPALDVPPLPREAAPLHAVRPLARAVVAALESGPRDQVPPVLLALGEGIVPTLTFILVDPRFGIGARAGVLRALAAIGGIEARVAIAALVEELEEVRQHPLWSAWWRAVNAVGTGRGLARAQALAVSYAKQMDFNPWRGPVRRLSWRDRQQYFRFLAACPPADGIEYVRVYLEWLIEQASENARRRLFPSLAASIIRAYLVICDPTEETLRQAVLCAQVRQRRGWQRREEELGEVIAMLAPYRERTGVQQGLDELLEADDLPDTVRAWALHLKGETPHEAMRAMAAELIDAEGGSGTLTQRRLGARLLGALGLPSPARIRSTVAEIDGTLQALGLDWAVRAA